MLDSLFRRPMQLEIGDRTLRFDSKADFEFALASRTEVPAAKISDLVRFTPEQLLHEASSVRQVERHFVEVLSRSIQDPGSIGDLLREMDGKMFSQDHEWRAIMHALARQDRKFDDFKQLALVKYMQYLASRQDVLKGIYTHKRTPGPRTAEPDAGPDTQFRETLIFDVSDTDPGRAHTQVAGGRPTGRGLVRLPRGERLRVHPHGDDAVSIVLSRHTFHVRGGSSVSLVGEDGEAQSLTVGRNVVGRHPDSDVMIDAAFRDVSRTHVIVEVEPDGGLWLTDLSSHGTWVHADVLRGASDA